MDHKELSLLLTTAAAASTARVLADGRGTGRHISKAQAYRLYGRSYVDRWMAEGLIASIPQTGKTSKNCIDTAIIEQVAARSNRNTYLPVAER
jgi:hypothetical protein